MLLVLTATAGEQKGLREHLEAPASQTFAHRQLHSGSIDGRPVSLLETGIGTVNTAQAVTAYLESETPDFVLQIGIGGAYRPSDLTIGDIAVATSEAYGEAGVVTSEGWKPLDEIGIPLMSGKPDIYNIIPVDEKLRLLDALGETSFEILKTPATTPAGIAVKLVIWARYHIREGHKFEDDLARFPVSDYTSLDLTDLPIISALHDLERLAGEARS